jgi:hypothetical protein
MGELPTYEPRLIPPGGRLDLPPATIENTSDRPIVVTLVRRGGKVIRVVLEPDE